MSQIPRRGCCIGAGLALCALLAFGAAPAGAQVAYSHVGASDPANEGWGITPGDVGTGVTLLPLTPDPLDGEDAWAVHDTSTASGSRLRYQVALTPAQLGDSDVRGWTLRVVLRVVEPAGAATDALDNSVIVEVCEGPGDRRYALRFGTDPSGDGDPVVSVLGGAASVSSGPSSYTAQGIGDAYQEYLLSVDPATGLATLFVDGQARIATYAGIDAGAVAPRINWGSGETGSTGRGNYRLVEWSLNTDRDLDGVPDTVDNCPSIQNNPNLDAAGVGDGSAPDGIGDACQCGDLDSSGAVGVADVARYRTHLASPVESPLIPDEVARCGVFGDPFRCALGEVVALRRAVAGLEPGIAQSCIAGQAYEETCGDGVCSPGTESCSSCNADCGACLIGEACLQPAQCASGACADGVCTAVVPVPGVPACGDGICNGDESCSRVGLHGCYDDCGPCSAAQAEHCLDDVDCDAGTCVLQGRCNVSGELCATNGELEEGDCPGAGDYCDVTAFGAVVFGGLCSDLETQCLTGPFGIHQQDTCDTGDHCRRRSICAAPSEGGCGAPPAYADQCPIGEECTVDEDCQSGVCTFLYVPIASEFLTLCMPPMPQGTPCLEDADCQGVCNAGFCVTDPLPTGVPCTLHAACQSGVCNGVCVPEPLPNGTPCLTSAACASGLCANGICHADDCGDGICNLPFESCATPDPGQPFGVRCQADCDACDDGHRCVIDDDCASGACDPFLRGCLSCRFLNNGTCSNGEQCDNDGDCGSGNCVGEQAQAYGFCAPLPPTCSNPTGRPNGCGCTSNGQCSSNDCVGYDGSSWCVPNSCTAPGEVCSSSGQCCDFPGHNLGCYDQNPLPLFTAYRCALGPF